MVGSPAQAVWLRAYGSISFCTQANSLAQVSAMDAWSMLWYSLYALFGACGSASAVLGVRRMVGPDRFDFMCTKYKFYFEALVIVMGALVGHHLPFNGLYKAR